MSEKVVAIRSSCVACRAEAERLATEGAVIVTLCAVAIGGLDELRKGLCFAHRRVLEDMIQAAAR